MMTVIIAHRGASALATHENTLEAFQIAINLQADFAEFDIRRTKDHQYWSCGVEKSSWISS